MNSAPVRNFNPSGRRDHRPDLIDLAARLTREAVDVAKTVTEIVGDPINEPDSWLLVPAASMLRSQLEWLEEVFSEVDRHCLYYGLEGRRKPSRWVEDSYDGALYWAASRPEARV